ncbi:condensation domain-containing protein [Nonomuraea sp. NPDC046802]|uniref:condensation domain-containing protein n=1 Tax=Nonomuraea sp. NPDC046802 TaxID=3154919 RepID=UPI0033C029C3
MSDLQMRWWAGERLLPDPSLIVPARMRVRATIDPAAMEAAAQEVAQRHEALRTRFDRVDGTPVQIIRRVPDRPLTWFRDLRDVAPAQRGDALAELLAADRIRGFELARGPLMRLGVIRCAMRDHILALTMHHIIADGWATAIFWRELSEAYDRALKGEELTPPSKRAAPRLRDWVAARQSALERGQAARENQYWTRALRRVRPLHVPHDLPANRGGLRKPHTRRFAVPREHVNDLYACSKRFRATPFMITMAVFMKLLGRYTGRRDVAVMTLLNRRGGPLTEDLIGCIFNHATIAIVIPPDATAGSLVKEVRGALLDAYDHQQVDAHRIWRETGFMPGSVDVLFIFDQSPQERKGVAFGGVRAELYWVAEENEEERRGPTTPGLKFSLELIDDRLVGALGYDANLYSKAFIDTFLCDYITLLEEIVHDEALENGRP